MRARLALVAFTALAITACAGQPVGQDAAQAVPPMTTADFADFCTVLPSPGSCQSDPICRRFRQELDNPPRDLTACLAMCRKTADALYDANLINSCAYTLDRAQDLCDQFCRRRDRS